MKALSYDEGLSRMAAFCSISEHCESEVRERLQKAAMPSSEIQKIVDHLYDEDYINTARYCRAFAHDRLRFARWGRLKIQQALRLKGLPDSDIREALDDLSDKEYKEALRATLEQKRRSLGDNGDDDYAIRAKLMRYAASHGFTPSEILDEIES